MANQTQFSGMPILCWTIDDWEQFDIAVMNEDPKFDLQEYIENYRKNVFQTKIDALFNGASIKLNLGGESEKVKIIASEKPSGIFDFSLAAKGLYRVQEYYSDRLEAEYPDKFSGYELPKGIVPPNLVKESYSAGQKTFYYEDDDGYFILKKQQKGTAAIDQKEDGAKLKYATKTKKVYLNYKRKGGKVKYVEIYSLFYFNVDDGRSPEGDVEFAIRHIPAMMVAEYLEKMGIMTRIYMTRFVQLNAVYYLRKTSDNGNELPMYKLSGGKKKFGTELFVQPIIAKEFGEEIDKSKAFMISSATYNRVYNKIAMYAQEKEVENKGNIQLYGNPIFQQEQYFVGIERYRNKYKQYVDLGIFKSKEVLPEAMLFFHDKTIALFIHRFCNKILVAIRDIRQNPNMQLSEALIDPYVNPFFSWWMKLSANTLKDKINIINSNELVKDITQIKRDAENNLEEFNKIISEIPATLRFIGNVYLGEYLKEVGNNIITEYGLVDFRGNFAFRQYITKITNEITTYAEEGLYATDEETIEKRDALVRDVLIAVSSL